MRRPEAAGFLAFAGHALAGSGCLLRAVTPADAAFIAMVYASTRSEELQQVEWTGAQKAAFTDWQSAQQEKHYAAHYPEAERLVIEQAGEAIGRIYVDTAPAEVRLMEVTLLPQWRRRGIGTRLLGIVLGYADGLGLSASLHVEPFNPARRMYARAGFATVETRGIYDFMVRPARPRAS